MIENRFSIDNVPMSVRTRNVLHNSVGIFFIDELSGMTIREFRGFQGVGKAVFDEVCCLMGECGVSFQ